MNRKTAGCLFLAIAISALLLMLFVNSPYYQLFEHSFVTETTDFRISDTEFEIEHSRIGIHPMMAEYDRWIAVHTQDARGERQEMAVDTCGGYPINCYLLDAPTGPILYLDDAVSEHVIDLARGTVSAYFAGEDCGYIRNHARSVTPKYLGRLDGKAGKLRFIPQSEAAATAIDYLFGRQRRW